MSEDQYRWLTLTRLPIFMSRVDASYELNRSPLEIEILEGKGVLRPCGRRRPRNGKVMYSTKEVLKLAEDPKSADRMADIIFKYWEDKNRNKKKGGSHQESGDADV